MAGAPSLIGGGEIPGLQLVAWAFIDGNTTPTVLKSFGVANVVRSGTGNYQVNFSAVLPSAAYMWIVKRNDSTAPKKADPVGIAAASARYQLTTSGANADDIHWVGIYQ